MSTPKLTLGSWVDTPSSKEMETILTKARKDLFWPTPNNSFRLGRRPDGTKWDEPNKTALLDLWKWNFRGEVWTVGDIVGVDINKGHPIPYGGYEEEAGEVERVLDPSMIVGFVAMQRIARGPQAIFVALTPVLPVELYRSDPGKVLRDEKDYVCIFWVGGLLKSKYLEE